jgi:hypothetical protein
MRLGVEVIVLELERTVPQRARGKFVVPFARNLPVEPAVGLLKTLVAEPPAEIDFALGPDFGRGDHRGEHVVELIVKAARGLPGKRAIERDATAEQEHENPHKGDDQHALAQRPGVRRGGAGRGLPHAGHRLGSRRAGQRSRRGVRRVR